MNQTLEAGELCCLLELTRLTCPVGVLSFGNNKMLALQKALTSISKPTLASLMGKIQNNHGHIGWVKKHGFQEN